MMIASAACLASRLTVCTSLSVPTSIFFLTVIDSGNLLATMSRRPPFLTASLVFGERVGGDCFAALSHDSSRFSDSLSSCTSRSTSSPSFGSMYIPVASYDPRRPCSDATAPTSDRLEMRPRLCTRTRVGGASAAVRLSGDSCTSAGESNETKGESDRGEWE